MSLSPLLALRNAVRERLGADAGLSARVSGVFDEPPSGAGHPYVVFGDGQMRDWSASLSRGVEILLPLHVWTTHRGMAEALHIAHRVAGLLDEATLAVEGCRLVNLRFVSLETRRDNIGRFARASLRFRAALEILE